MYVLEDNSAIESLIKKDIIPNLNTLARMKYKDDYKIIVDNLIKPKGYIFTSKYWNMIYSPYDDVAKKMINKLEIDKNKGFCGVLDKYFDIIKNDYDIEWEEQCYLYYLDKDDLNYSYLKHDVKELRIKDAETLNEYYTYKEEGSLEYIKECIENGPTACIFDENDEPISWAVVREDGSMGIMYTKKEYRGRGLAQSVSVFLAKKILEKGNIPYVHIVVGNDASVKLAESIGFRKYGNITWFGVK